MIKKCFIFCVGVLSCASGLFSNETLMSQDIRHVVVLMLENRSFDNLFAWLYEHDAPLQFIPENTDPHFMGLSEDNLYLYTNSVRNLWGKIVFTCPPLKGTPSLAGLKGLNSPQYDPNEPFPNVTKQIFGFSNGNTPTMLGFLQDYATLWDEWEWLENKKFICGVMETYTQQQLPVLYGLAKHYAISDLWFSSVPTQTNPNRAFAFCGTSDGQTVNGPLGNSTFNSDTIWNRLTDLSPETTWSIFWQADRLQGIFEGPLSGPETFPSLKRIPGIDQHFLRIDKFHELARNGQLPAVSFLEPQWTISQNLDTEDNVLSNIKDLLFGLEGNDLHPPGDVRTGENFVANIYTSLIADPEAWNHTLFVITFDEHGGLFDHVPPPAAISPDKQFQEGFKFDRYGVRVPTLFISPKVARKVVIRSDQPEMPFDHTSLIATILNWSHIDRKQWKLGLRTDKAPIFDAVVALTEPRQDSVLVPEGIVLAQVVPENVIQMGEALCLKDSNGNYVYNTKEDKIPYVGHGKKKAVLRFVPGSGQVTHGSFVLIQSEDPNLCDANILQANWLDYDCIFSKNCHDSSQWWTIKSVDHPYVGSEIHYGEKVYLENHIYVNVTQYVPGRLAKKQGVFGKYLSTESILDDGCDKNYWILERP